MEQLEALAERLSRMEGAVEEIRDAVKTISTAIVNIALLDQKHNDTTQALSRAFDAISKHDDRIGKLEVSLPVLQLTSRWVITAAMGILALVGAAVVALILK